MGITHIRAADWAIVWDADAAAHRYARDVDVAFDDSGILHVGPGYVAPETAEVATVDGRGLMVMPGLIDAHSHPTAEPFMRGLSEERKSRQFFMSTLYEFIQLVGRSPKTATLDEMSGSTMAHMAHDEGTRRAAARLAMYEMLKSGVTTVMDYSPMRPGWVEDIDAIGIRTVFAPSFRSGTWYTPNGRNVLYDWDEAAGERAFTEAMTFLDGIAASGNPLHHALVACGQVDTCTPDLIRAAHAEAVSRNLPMTIHASQSVVEFREMMSRHGMTPLAWLESLGVLDRHMTIGHAIFVDEHSWIRWPDHDDIDRLARSGASVAHCPNQFARGGVTLEWLNRYLDRGINVAIGTDTFPHNMLDEMRWAAVLAKVASRDVDGASSASVFACATTGGAKALMQDRLGRLDPGCVSDVVTVDITHPMMQPARDPLRGLLFSAQDRAVRDVWVGGRKVVDNGTVLTIDVESACATLTAGQAHGLKDVPKRDWAGRSAEEAFPLALPIMDDNHHRRSPLTATTLTNAQALLGEAARLSDGPVDIVVREGKIAEIRPAGAREPEGTAVDCTGLLLTPGLINGHHHSHEHFYKGRKENLPLELWMNYVRPLKPIEYTPRQVYLRTMIGALEAVRTGTTTMCDDLNVSPHIREDHVEAAHQAYEDVGIRALVGITLFDRPFFRAVPFVEEEFPPELLAELDKTAMYSGDELLAFAGRLARDHHPKEKRVGYIAAPSAPQRCSADFIRSVRRLADDYDLPVMMHVQETRMQVVTGGLWYGSTMVEYLDSLGFMKPNTQFIHAVWLNPRELDLIAERGVSIQHNPTSNLKVGSGLIPLRAVLDAGINVSLGTDGCGSIENVDMQVVLTTGALLQKLRGDHTRWPGAADMYRAGTLGGATSLGREGELGAISEGYIADLTGYRLDALAFTPLNEPVNQLVYSASRADVAFSMVDGEVVLKDGAFTRVDEAALIAEIHAAHKTLEPVLGQSEKDVEVLLAPYERIYRRCQNMPIAPDTYPARFEY